MSSISVSNLFNVDGLVAVITGGGSGIGLMMTKALALNGAKKVYIIGRRKEVLEAATKESPHGNIVPIVGDVTSKDDLQAAVKQISEDTGYINVLIANSGIVGPHSQEGLKADTIEEFQAAFWELNAADYSKTFDVNVTAVFFTTIAFLGLLSKGNQKGNVTTKSQVIVTSSIAGFNRGVPAGFAYGQSKAAATLLTKQLSTNLAPFDVRVNALAPGLFPSDMAGPIIGQGGPIAKTRIPLQRIGSEEEMAGTILYLTSNAGGYCSGLILLVDGGRLSTTPNSY